MIDLGYGSMFDSDPFLGSFEDDLAELFTLATKVTKNTDLLLLEYVNDFEGFCRDILGVMFWDGQRKMARLIQENPRVAIAACYGSGKTFWAACLVIWWLWTRRPCLVVTTAPTGRQVRELLWSDIRKIHLASKKALGGKILVREARISPDRRGLGFSGDKPNSVAGYHERENVLFIEDESAGMKRDVVEGFEGLTITPGSKHVKIGNPVADDGPFWDCFNDPRVKRQWATYSIGAYETPNVKGKTVLIAGLVNSGLAAFAAWRTIRASVHTHGLVSYEWVEERHERWGPEHPLYIVRVLGRWYLQSGGKLVVPVEWVQAAVARHAEHLEGGLKIPTLGVDVGGGVGQDFTVCYKRHGRRAKFAGAWNEGEMPDQAARVGKLAAKLGCKRICVDGTGLGKGLYDNLRHLKRKGDIPSDIEIHLVKLGNKATKPDEFDLIVDQVWWEMRRAFDPEGKEPIAIDPKDRDLIEQLPHRTWSILKDGTGAIKVERKIEMKARGCPHPDWPDALAMTFYEPPPGRAFAA